MDVNSSRCVLQTPGRGPETGMGGEACPHKLGSTNHLRLLLYILIPTVSLLAGLLLLVLALTGNHHTHTFLFMTLLRTVWLRNTLTLKPGLNSNISGYLVGTGPHIVSE